MILLYPVQYKRFTFIGLTVLLVLQALISVSAVPVARQWLIITNPAPFKRVNEVISISRENLNVSVKELIPMVERMGEPLISQMVDTDQDGTWDVLLVAVNLAPHATDTLQIVWVGKPKAHVFEPSTGVRLSLRSDNNKASPSIEGTQRRRGFIQDIARPFYQMEGPGIENDKVAFRAFFDYRNGKDIYGKIISAPVLEQVGVGASWHTLQPWGMDILQVGNSLGAGALAVEEDKKIYRLGDADTSTFQSLYQGALRAAFKLDFKNWDVAAGKKDGSETVSVTKGDFFYRNDISVPLDRDQHLVVGIAHFGTEGVTYTRHNAVFSSVATYGHQAEGTKTLLGLAILFPSGDYLGNKEADSLSVIPNTAYVILKALWTGRQHIRFFACWEKTDARFSTRQGFFDYLQETADKLANPIQIKIINKR